VTSARIVEIIAEADGSAGWCVMIATQNTLFHVFLDEDSRAAVWGNGGVVAGTARPTGRAVITDGGYIVSGSWPFASGSSHATHFLGECTVYEGDSPRKDANGNNVTRMCFIPRSAVKILDTWDTLGLRGTASNDFSTENTFVPEGHGLQVFVTEPVVESVVNQAMPLFCINQGTHALGVAQAAINAGIETARSKVAWGGQLKVSETPRLQVAIAEAVGMVEAARSYLYAVSEELLAEALAKRPNNPLLRSRVRLATSHAAQASRQAVDTIHTALATSGLFKANPLERYFRDIHTAAAHVMVGALTFESAGRVEVGMEPNFPFF
jgi:alkylation response protein AidB-like acyl-CoA dehydrogenase